MRKALFALTTAAALVATTGMASAADGCSPTYDGGVYCLPGARPGVPYNYGRYYRDYDSPRYGGYARYGGCRTITIQRDDGSFKRIRRCD